VASPNDGQRVASNWQAVVSTTPEDQVHGDYWLFNRMSSGKGFKGLSGGDSITGPIEYALNSTVQSYSDTDTFATGRVDVFDRYEYDWKEYVGTIVMSELEKDRNAGEGELFALAPAKMENLRMSLRGNINADAYGDGTGNNGKAVDGLQKLVAVNPLLGTVGGINRATFSFFRNQTLSGAGTAFSILRAAMRSLYNLCSNGVGDQHPTFGVTDRTTFEGYEGLLTPNERFTDKSSGDGGFKNEVVKFKGMLLSYDNACLTAAMYMLNERFYKWIYKTGSWMKARPAINPANQTVDIVAIRTMFNTIATAPRRLGVIYNIA
jgi:hypothetical protein